MERRDRSLKALQELIYIDSLEASDRATGLIRWVEAYLPNEGIYDFDLELKDLQRLSELFYSNINFLHKHKEDTRQELMKTQRMRTFLKH